MPRWCTPFCKARPAGPTDEAVLLRDEEATAARITGELTRLREAAAAGDEIIFYFAGHGDVERIAETRRGRLLAYDAPVAQNYVGNGGTIPIQAVRDVMNEIVQKGARVVLLTDACRAGSVNNDIGAGAALTSAVLAAEWSRVFRFVSSGAQQLSQESPDLGHGVFTYYLLNGLLGAADGLMEADGQVDHTELEMYVKREVGLATGRRQMPVLTGDPERPLAVVSSEVTWATLETLVPPRAESGRYQLLGELDADERRAAFDEALSDSARARVRRFQAALDAGRLLGDGGALDLYEALRGDVPTAYFARFGHLLATALEDRAQALLASDLLGALLGGGGGAATSTASLAGALPADDIAAAATALDHALALRGVTYPNYPSLRSRARLLRGLSAFLAGDYGEAVGTLGEVDPPSALALTALGLAHYKQKDMPAAYAALARAVALAPNWSEPRRYQGFVAQFEGTWDDALAFYEEAAARAPEDALVQVDIGEVHAKQGDLDAADAAWTRALALDPVRAAPALAGFLRDRARLPNRLDRAARYYEAAVRRAPDSVPLLVAQADFLRTAGRADAAEAAYRRALALDAGYAAAHNGLGVLYEVQARYDEALAAYRRAADAAPDAALVHRNQGDVYRALERYDEAEAAYRRAVAADAGYAPSYLGLGYVYAATDRLDEAETVLQQHALTAQSADAYNALGVFYETKAQRYDDAITAYEQARELGATALILANLGDAYRKAARYYLAVDAYNQALRLDPAQALALRGLDRLEDHGVVPPRDRAAETLPGTLTPDAATLDDGTFYAAHPFDGRAGEEWTVLLRSEAFDPYLLVTDETGGRTVLGRDDDGGGGLSALVQVTLPRDGRYALLANTVRQGRTGPYELVFLRSRPESQAPAGAAQTFRGTLAATSPTLDDGSHYAVHTVEGRAGETLDVTLASDAFDALVAVLDAARNVLVRDDDSGEGRNARAQVALPADGTYTLLVNSYAADATGAYTLTVRRSAGGDGTEE